MTYTPPTLAELRTGILRDLRDADAEVFTVEQVNDFIRLGIMELNRARPLSTRIEYPGDTDFLVDALPFSYVFMVQIAVQRSVDDVRQWETLHPANATHGYGADNGWDYFAGHLMLWSMHVSGIANNVAKYGADQVTIAVWGYADRDLPDSVDGVAVPLMDSTDELAVRKYAQYEGLKALDQDRALFAQWQAANNSADISPTQLLNMVGQASSDWREMRRRIFVIRRPLVD